MSNSTQFLLAFLDTGILSRLSKKPHPEFQECFNKVIKKVCLDHKKETIKLADSPSLFLEQLSIKPKAFKAPIQDAEDAVQWYAKNISAIKHHFESLPELTFDYFEKKYNEEAKYVTDANKYIYEHLFQSKLKDQDAKDFLIIYLTAQTVQALPIPKRFRNEAHQQAFLSAIAYHTKQVNIPFLKTSSMILKEVQTVKSWKNSIVYFAKNRLARSLGLHVDGDHVDSDIIHFSCFGYWSDKELHQIHAFTTDEVDKITDRIFIYRAQLKYFWCDVLENYPDPELKSLCTLHPPLEGFVYVLNPDGTLKTTIDVSQLNQV